MASWILLNTTNIASRVALAAVLVLGATEASSQDANVFRRLLVPMSVSQVPGAYGSLWSTELWYRNNSDRPIAVEPLAISDTVPSMRRTVPLRIFTSPAHAPGQILFVNREGSENVQFDLRVYNRADPSAVWGTKLPVVWEEELARTINLINVPTNSDFRSTLRVYAFLEEWPAGETARVRVYSHNEQLLAETMLDLTGVPRYGAIALADAFPQIRQAERVRVEVVSSSGEAKLWAFVSVTSNVTQFVSVVTQE